MFQFRNIFNLTAAVPGGALCCSVLDAVKFVGGPVREVGGPVIEIISVATFRALLSDMTVS
jgi:hypothetical protein